MNTTTSSILDALIEDISSDQQLLEEIDQRHEKVSKEKREVTQRLKDYRNDASVLLKYSDEEQRSRFEELGYYFHEMDYGLNPVASIALETLMKAKGNQMTNGALYEAYVATFKKKEDAVGYAEFNVKCRPLYSTQRALRTKTKDAKSSREDTISLNRKAGEQPKS